MRKIALLSLSALAAILGSGVPAAAQARGQVIYGEDNRIDVYQTSDPRLRKLAGSTVGLFQESNVSIAGGIAKLTTDPYASRYSLCKDERFYDQASGAFCSGSLIAPDVIMTAGHCVRSESDCAGVKFVFGFAIKEKGKFPSAVLAQEVYGCKQLLGRDQINTGVDWALVKLDRPVVGHEPLPLNKTGKIAKGAPLVVIGHPAGLPTKIAGGASVREVKPEGYFVADLDTYGGNSGSAVFNDATGLIEGILVRGEVDYESRGDCRVSKVCPKDGCRGEDVTGIAAVNAKLPGALHRSRVKELGPTVASLLDAVAAVQP